MGGCCYAMREKGGEVEMEGENCSSIVINIVNDYIFEDR